MGQHREMLDQVVEIFRLPVHHDLDVMTAGQTLASLSSKLIAKIDVILETEKPDFALVQGDTTTVLMATLACFYRRTPTGRVEAGLRTGGLSSPFLDERVPANRVFVTGNTVIDALHLEVERQREPEIAAEIATHLADVLPADWREKPFVLITGHRRENFGAGFESICATIAELAERFPDVRFAYPVHLNPNVQ